jgi:hypothetical protein
MGNRDEPNLIIDTKIDLANMNMVSPTDDTGMTEDPWQV